VPQDRLAHRRVLVAENHRPPGADIVDIALAVGVGQPGAIRRRDEARHAADCAERAHRRIDPARDAALGAVEEDFGTIHESSFQFPVNSFQQTAKNISRKDAKTQKL